MKHYLILVAGAILLAGCASVTGNGAIDPAMACWVQSAANAAQDAYAKAGQSTSIPALAAGALSTASGYDCTIGSGVSPNAAAQGKANP